MTKYGNLLKTLIKFSGSKLSAVSEVVGYDVSYISRWCNKDTLPILRASHEINHMLSTFFANEIIEHGDVADFASVFSVSATAEHLDSVIYKLLQNAYKSSSTNKDTLFTKNESMESQILTSSKDICYFFSHTFSELLDSYNEPLDIYCTMELYSFLNDNSFYFLENIKPNYNIRVRMALNEKVFMSNDEKPADHLYHFISTHSHLLLEFYNHEPMQFMNTIIVKNHLAIICALNRRNKILAATIISDLNKISEFSYPIISAFNHRNLLISTSAADTFYKNDYRADFYTKNHYQLFLTKGFEFLLPEVCWKSLYETAYIKNKSMLGLVSQIRVAWEEIFEKCSIDFFIPKSVLLDYIETGQIVFSSIPYTLTAEERKLHAENILTIIKKNPNINFYIVDLETLSTTIDINISIYSNPRKVFLKNLSTLSVNGNVMFHTLLSETLTKKARASLEDLKTKPFCIKYTSKEVEKIYNKYSTLLYRMIDL